MPRKSITEKAKCFVHENLPHQLLENTRKNVCQSLQITKDKVSEKYYCLLHLPSKFKTEEFNIEFQKRLDEENFDFTGVYFPSTVYFSGEIFQKELRFFQATFTQNITFYSSICEKGIDFRYALFEENTRVFFRFTSLHGALDFREASIKGTLRFEGHEELKNEDGELVDNFVSIFDGLDSWLDLQNAIIDKPEQMVFQTVRLQPNWFINTDCRKFVFTDCYWTKADGKDVEVLSEIQGAFFGNGTWFHENPNLLITKACRQLADNYEENKEFEEALMFRKIANESKRYEYDWWYQPLTLHWWYWLTSFYGESWKRALGILFTILLVFTLIYTQTDFQTCSKNQPLTMSITECKIAPENCRCENGGLSIKESVLQTFSTALFQNSEYRKPISFWSEFWIILEKILAPLQATLLALAIRRRFMR